MAEEDSGFKVADRRLFTSDGELRETTEPSVEPDFQEAGSSLHPSDQADEPMNFQTLVFSLSTTALMQLGVAPHPESGKSERDLPGAKQTIDILEVLQLKTRGNLTAEESQLLEECLCDLKMTYVKMVQGRKP